MEVRQNCSALSLSCAASQATTVLACEACADPVEARVHEDGAADQVEVAVLIPVHERPASRGRARRVGAQGRVAQAGAETWEQVGAVRAAENGVFVQGLRRPGNAARSGLRRGDIIVRADGVAIESIADLDAVYECAANRDGEPVVLIEVLRRGARRQVVLDFRREYGP